MQKSYCKKSSVVIKATKRGKFGIGIPKRLQMSQLKGVGDEVILTVESGLIGGIPIGG